MSFFRIPDIDDITFAVASIILCFWTVYWLVHILSICYGKYRLHRRISLDPEQSLPGVTILKPLVGVDSNLACNLESYFSLNYPKFELLFCIQTDSDPSYMLVQSLIAKYPQVDVRVFTGGKTVGLNPKINNMMPGYEAAKYDLLLISDSGIKMKEDTLLDIVDSMKENVGLVTQMPFCCDRKGFAGTLEKVYFGTAHARIYLGADAIGVVCSTGMSCLIRKPVLDQLGGIKAFSQYLAEDYFFAHAIAAKGWKCAISSQPAWQNCGVCEVAQFHGRLARWAKLRIAMLPHTMILEPLQECVLLGLLTCWAVNILLGWNSLVFMLTHMLAWMLLDYVLLCIVQNGPLPFGKFEYLISWLFRELSAFPLFLKAMCNQTIYWRVAAYRLRWGGVAELVTSKH